MGTEAEYFNVEDGRIKIGWMRPNCYSQNTIQEDAVKSDFLVYQITFFPKEPLPNSFIQKAEMTPASDLFAVYWGNCLKGGNGTFSCNLMTPKYGFGYSNSQDGVAALYFIPTEKDLADWEEKLKPCSVEQK